MPFSVIHPVISPAGVTSNAGFQTGTPAGAQRRPAHERTSSAERSSTVIPDPEGQEKSNVDEGATT